MVSMFLSELKGVLKCSRQQMTDYLAKHPKLHMAAELMADPNWSGISTLMLEPGAAPGKHKYFDAEQLNEQSKLAMDIFDATHVAPGRWVYHPCSRGDFFSRRTAPTLKLILLCGCLPHSARHSSSSIIAQGMELTARMPWSLNGRTRALTGRAQSHRYEMAGSEMRMA